MPWLVAGFSVAIPFLIKWGGRLFRTAGPTAAVVAAGVAPAAAGAYVGGKLVDKFPWWLLLLIAPVGLFVWLMFKKPAKQKTDSDFYAGALGLDPAEAAKCSKEYLAGKLSKQRRDEKWANNPEVAGLRASGITMQFGKQWGKSNGY